MATCIGLRTLAVMGVWSFAMGITVVQAQPSEQWEGVVKDLERLERTLQEQSVEKERDIERLHRQVQEKEREIESQKANIAGIAAESGDNRQTLAVLRNELACTQTVKLFWDSRVDMLEQLLGQQRATLSELGEVIPTLRQLRERDNP